MTASLGLEVTGRRNPTLAKGIFSGLEALDEKLVLAESCTGGMVAANMVTVPGVSQFFCGSFVTYRPKSKRGWVGVKKSTIKAHTSQSRIRQHLSHD